MFQPVRFDQPSGDEAEKPFWISYADLMTSLTVLFLVVMLASLVSLNRTVADLQDTRSRAEVLADRYKDLKAREAAQRRRVARQQTRIASFWDGLARDTRGLGVHLDSDKQVIDFGDRGRFKSGSDELAPRDEVLVRRFTAALLARADTTTGRQVLRRAVVEGYADRRGSYLYNLNLSLSRSQRVLCTLVAPGGRSSLGPRGKQRVRQLFLVGGFSTNSQRASLAASRRVEIRLEFFGARRDARRPKPSRARFGDCALDV